MNSAIKAFDTISQALKKYAIMELNYTNPCHRLKNIQTIILKINKYVFFVRLISLFTLMTCRHLMLYIYH